MKQNIRMVTLVSGLLLVSHAWADSDITADLGTTGIGAHISFPLEKNLNARIGANYLNYSYNGNTSSVNYDLTLKLKTFDALLDYFPAGGSFRLTGGLAYNGSTGDGQGKPNDNGTYTLNGTTYTAANAGTIVGNMDFRKSAPYLGIGWGNPVKEEKGWGLSSDFGVLFLGNPTTSLTNTGCTLPTTPTTSCSTLASDVAAENANLEDKVKQLRYFPVLRVDFTYTF